MNGPERGGVGIALIAWLAMLPASLVGEIVARVLFHAELPGWVAFAGLALLLALVALTRASLDLRPLGGYLLALAAIGVGRRTLFLTRGDLRARRPLPFGLPTVSWALLGPALAVLFAGPLALQLILKAPPDPRLLSRALASLPLALAFAAFNAAQEQFRFRMVLLARLAPVVGAGQALLVTSTLFGIGHWFGHPSGASGVLMAGLAGYVWGRSILDTRGFFWAWLSHGMQDVLIFLLVLMSGR